MADIYPEWIQEQLDRREREHPPGEPLLPLRLLLKAMEGRVLRYIALRFDRIEAKLDRLLAYCEGEWKVDD